MNKKKTAKKQKNEKKKGKKINKIRREKIMGMKKIENH